MSGTAGCYPISHIFVINPPVLGAKRRRLFDRQFDNWQKPVPPISYFGINKNHLAAVDESRYRHLIKDDRSGWTKLKLRMGWEKNAENFKQVYDQALRTDEKVTAVVEIGRVANALSHLRTWKQCAEFADGELCMVVEDRAVINPEIDFDRVNWPQGAELMHLWPGSVGSFKAYSDDYVELVPKWSPGAINWRSSGYIITPACARRYLATLLPYKVNRTIDMELWYGGRPKAFAVRSPWVRPRSVVTQVSQRSALYVFARQVLYWCRFFLPRTFRERHPYLLDDELRFDEPRLDP